MVDFLLIRAVQNIYELLGKGREFVTMFPCVEIFMHLGYKKLASWLMSWVSLKAFPHFPPRRVSEDPSQYFRSRRAQESAWAPAVTQVLSAHLLRQEYKGGGWPGFWERGWARRNHQQKGGKSWWAAAAVTSRAPSVCLQSRRFFCALWAPKGHRAEKSGRDYSSAIFILW